MLTLGRGVVTGIGKRPSATAPVPPVRLTAPAVRVDPARLAAYASVCGFPASGAGPLPLTYPHVLGFPLAARIMASRAFPLPMLGLVHTSISLVSRAPLTAADRPDITAYAAGLRGHRRGTEVELVTEARVDGEVVWEDRSTYLARHGGGAGGGSASGGVAGGGGGDRAPLPVVGEWRLAADLGRRHARVSRDYNPIHLYPVTARMLGFPRAIAHGMWTVARCAAEVPEAGGLEAVFHAPVLLPGTVTYGAAAGAFEVRSPGRLHLTGVVSGP
ncbi:MaoC/PaaZ C-terminal domain-containing protein [Streptomyces sp. NPDC008317]|uniref:MaoC family dehydratase n=1 Tax=Streptomyces sp. NPDC008317 TaxID=3364827 RepID=UPI0036E5B2C5